MKKKYILLFIPQHIDENNNKIMNIGTHIQKSGSFIQSLLAFYNAKPENLTRPVQLFSGSPKWWRRPNVKEEDATLTRAFVESNNLSVFVHSLYLINNVFILILKALKFKFLNIIS